MALFRGRWAAPAGLAALGVAHVLPALLTGSVYARNDYGAELVPALDTLRGHVPFFGAPGWNPSIFGGAPAEVLPTMARYPLSIIAYAIPAAHAVPLLVGLHLAIAAITAWLFVRRVAGVSDEAALFGAIVYAFGGALWLRGMHLQNLAVAAWMPWILLSARDVAAAATRERRRHAAAALAIGATLALSAGGGVPLLMITAISSVPLIADGLNERVDDGTPRRDALAAAAPWIAGAAAVALLAAMPAWLPLVEVARGAARGKLTLMESGAYSLNPPALARLLSPDLLVGPVEWSWPSYVERFFYFGVLTLPLAGLAARDPRGRFLLLLAVAATVLGLGLFGPLHYLFYFLLPGYSHLRAPGRWAIAAGLAFGCAAAKGLDLALTGPAPRRAPRIAAAATAAAALIAAIAPGPPARLGFALEAAVAALWLLGASTTRRRALALAVASLIVAADVCSIVARRPLEEDPSALAPPAAFAAAAALVPHSRLSHDDAAGPRPLNGGGRWGYRDARGYSQLVPATYSRLLDLGAPPRARFTGAPERDDAALSHLLGIGVFVGLDSREAPAGFDPAAAARSGGLAAWTPDDPPFVAAVVDHALVVAPGSAEDAAALFVKPETNAVLAADAGLAARADDATPAGRAAVTHRDDDEVDVTVDADRDGLLVLGEAWHPRWRATVDGAAAPVLRADAIWRAVKVPKGTHEVRFVCRSGAPWWSWIGTAIGIALIVGVWRDMIGRRR